MKVAQPERQSNPVSAAGASRDEVEEGQRRAHLAEEDADRSLRGGSLIREQTGLHLTPTAAGEKKKD